MGIYGETPCIELDESTSEDDLKSTAKDDYKVIKFVATKGGTAKVKETTGGFRLYAIAINSDIDGTTTGISEVAAAKSAKVRKAVVNGRLVIETANGTFSATGVISDDDNTIIGNVNPDFTGGFGLNIRAYGFDLAANFNFSVGNDIYNANKIEYTSTSKYMYRSMITDMADGKRWTNLNDDGTLCNDSEKLRAMNANTTMWSPYMKSFVLTDWAIEDASFLRLNTLTLGYTLPASLTKKAHISTLRFYATAYNVFTLTNYSGFDPESDCIRRSALTPG